MIFRPFSKIQVSVQGKILQWNFVSEAECEDSWKSITNSGKISIPKNVNFFIDKNITATPDSLFKRGQRVVLQLGYFPKLRTVFDGYISNISNNVPFILEVEDAMWLLKQEIISAENANKVNRTKQITLKQLLTFILPDKFKYAVADPNNGKYGFYAIDTVLGDWAILHNATVMDVLDKLKSEFTLFSWFKGGVLYVGLRSYPQDPVTKVNAPIIDFNFEENILKEGNTLVYKRSDDVKIRLVIKHIKSKVDVDTIKAGKQTQLVFGDASGDTVEQYFFNVPEADLKKAAERRIQELKYEGFRGEFTTFGEPFVTTGDLVRLKSSVMPERDGIYLVKSVSRTFGSEGYRQKISIDIRIDNPNLVDNPYAFLL